MCDVPFPVYCWDNRVITTADVVVAACCLWALLEIWAEKTCVVKTLSPSIKFSFFAKEVWVFTKRRDFSGLSSTSRLTAEKIVFRKKIESFDSIVLKWLFCFPFCTELLSGTWTGRENYRCCKQESMKHSCSQKWLIPHHNVIKAAENGCWFQRKRIQSTANRVAQSNTEISFSKAFCILSATRIALWDIQTSFLLGESTFLSGPARLRLLGKVTKIEQKVTFRKVSTLTPLKMTRKEWRLPYLCEHFYSQLAARIVFVLSQGLAALQSCESTSMFKLSKFASKGGHYCWQPQVMIT